MCVWNCGIVEVQLQIQTFCLLSNTNAQNVLRGCADSFFLLLHSCYLSMRRLYETVQYATLHIQWLGLNASTYASPSSLKQVKQRQNQDQLYPKPRLPALPIIRMVFLFSTQFRHSSCHYSNFLDLRSTK